MPPYLYSIDNEVFSSVNGAANLSGGSYLVITQDANGCLIEQTVAVDEPTDFVVYAGEDIFLKLGERADLDGQILPYFGQIIHWIPSDSLSCSTCPNPYFYPVASGQMNFLVTDTTSGCFKQDSLLIFVEKVKEVYLPNVFSPNQDGENDSFTVFAGAGVKQILKFQIFSRWGNLVFENYEFAPNNGSEGWDGTFQNKTLNPNVYVWKALVEFKDGEVKWFNGDVTLVR